MESLKEVLEIISVVIDAIGVLILIIGALKFTVRYVIFEFNRVTGLKCVQLMKDMRIEMGSYILLALEILIVSDVIQTSISHSIEDFYLLGLLVAVSYTHLTLPTIYSV